MCGSAERLRFFRWAAQIAFLLVFYAAASVGHAQADATVCSAGDGSFQAAFRTGVKVEVGAARRDGFAVRMCQGTLSWDKSTLVVAPSAFEVDVDALGINLGLGTQVVTFQVKQTAEDCCSKLLIYSLQKPPKLLRTITGGGSYSTADRNLNGDVEIWMNDAESMQDFDDPIFARAGFAPVVALRFVRGRLWDVGSEFQNIYDDAIASARGELSPEDLRDFKNTGGRLSAPAGSAEEMRRKQGLELTKIRVLQIVWTNLYSGREQDAWNALAEIWPAEDFDRIKAEIVRARRNGVLAQVEGRASATRPPANTARIFDVRAQTPQPVPSVGRNRTPSVSVAAAPAVVPPVPIYIAHVASENETEDDLPASEMVELTIDAAGKVRSVQAADPAFAAKIKADIAIWKFIPAMEEGRPVASRMSFILSPKR